MSQCAPELICNELPEEMVGRVQLQNLKDIWTGTWIGKVYKDMDQMQANGSVQFRKA